MRFGEHTANDGGLHGGRMYDDERSAQGIMGDEDVQRGSGATNLFMVL